MRQAFALDPLFQVGSCCNMDDKFPVAEVTIRNRKGLHARASAKFVKCAEKFDAQVEVSRDGQTVDGTSIMGLMMLAASPGSTIMIKARRA